MDGLEPVGVAVLMKAVDFLFSEATKIMQERREKRSATEKDKPPAQTNDEAEPAKPTSRSDVLSWKPNESILRDTAEELEHYIDQIELYRKNKRKLEWIMAEEGGYKRSSLSLQNQYDDTEKQIQYWYQKLKKTIEQSYGREIIIPNLEQ